MTHLFREFLGKSALLEFPILALVLFFIVFSIVLGKLAGGWLRRESYDRMASLPLDETREGEVRREAR